MRQEITSAGADRAWHGYVVAVSEAGDVLGAAGGEFTESTVGNVYLLYLDLALRGRGIGTALLDFITEQQRREGATDRTVGSVTEGNELGIPFYLARGFGIRQRIPFVVSDDGTVEAHPLRMSRAI